MILVDTSVWVDHLRRGNAALKTMLLDGKVAVHPFIIGELACGSLKARSVVLELLQRLPQVPVAEHREVLDFVRRRRLYGSGIGWIDAHLLASSLLGKARLYTLDRTLRRAATVLDIGL